MIASEDNRSCDFALSDGLIEGEGYLCTSFAVGIKDTCLRAYHEVVPSGLSTFAANASDFARSSGFSDIHTHLNGPNP